eukprot:831399-Alexandrium_andersonii.AAC.1
MGLLCCPCRVLLLSALLLDTPAALPPHSPALAGRPEPERPVMLQRGGPVVDRARDGTHERALVPGL